MKVEAGADLIHPDTTLLLPSGRNRLLSYLPKNGRVAEIGVFRGRFSRKILARARPRHLTLVDAWDLDVEGGHIPKRGRFTERQFSRIATTLPRYLKLRHPRAKIDVCRSYSAPAAERFRDGEFDWIYIDADHSYQGVMADLKAWAPKVREDGLILGHDFTDQNETFGVIRAVADFIRHADYRLLCVTTDYFPTFVLSRNLSGVTAQFLNTLFPRERWLYQLETGAVLSMSHRRYSRGSRKTGQLGRIVRGA